MAKKSLDLSQLSDDFIKSKVLELSQALLTETSHTFSKIGRIKIIDAATNSYNTYSDQAQSFPAIALIEVILAANRDYNKHVLPNIIRLKKNYPSLISFKDLEMLTKDKGQFLKIWGPKDDKKYKTLVDILDAVNSLREKNPDVSDYQILNNWANTININKYANDSIGKIYNIALATVQHLRMVFGANTVKPDQRVMEVLEREFNLKHLNQAQSIKAVEHIAKVTNNPALLIDQIFVLYGSGYYNKNETRDRSVDISNTVVLAIAQKLKNFGIDPDVISQSTNLSLETISDL